MASNYRPVLVPEQHVEAVERYIYDLKGLDDELDRTPGSGQKRGAGQQP